MSIIPNLIIGAGPAGLAIAGRLRKRNIPFEILEQSHRVANAWHQHYDRLHLHTMKEYSYLPHAPFPKKSPTYIPRKDLAAYYVNYAKKMGIKPIFGQEVVSIIKQGEHWVVKTKMNEYLAQKVIIATGVNRKTVEPTWKGQENYQGQWTHSRWYKNGKHLKDKKVLVIGMGNTGAEVALDLYEHGAKAFISIRGPINIVPRDIFGRPTQATAMILAKFPNAIGDWLGTQTQKLFIGDLSKYGIETLDIPPSRQIREYGITPVMDLGTVAQIKKGTIKILPEVLSFHKTGANLKNGESHDFDAVILATGYKAKIAEFVPSIATALDQYGMPKQSIAEGQNKGLFFVGFDNYNTGGILWNIVRSSKEIADAIGGIEN